MIKNSAYNVLGIGIVILAMLFGTHSAGALRAGKVPPSVLSEVPPKKFTKSEKPNVLAPESALLSEGIPIVPLTIPQNSPAPEVIAHAGLIQELGAGRALYEKDIKARWPIASITKFMTALVAFEKYGRDALVPISKTALSVESAKTDMKVGQKYSVKDLVYAMMLESRNEAAEALAEFSGLASPPSQGGRDAFIKAMNDKAAALGMQDTVFADPTGVSSLNQSTSSDLVLLTNHIFVHEHAIFEIAAYRARLIKDTVSGRELIMRSIHPFAGEKNFLGGKTGYTEDSKGNLLSLFEYRGRPFLFIILGATDRSAETRKLYDWLKSQ